MLTSYIPAGKNHARTCSSVRFSHKSRLWPIPSYSLQVSLVVYSPEKLYIYLPLERHMYIHTKSNLRVIQQKTRHIYNIILRVICGESNIRHEVIIYIHDTLIASTAHITRSLNHTLSLRTFFLLVLATRAQNCTAGHGFRLDLESLDTQERGAI